MPVDFFDADHLLKLPEWVISGHLERFNSGAVMCKRSSVKLLRGGRLHGIMGMVSACKMLQEFNGGHVLPLLFLTGAYLQSVEMQGHHGDAVFRFLAAGCKKKKKKSVYLSLSWKKARWLFKHRSKL